METREALAFVRENHRAVLATTRAGGGVQMSPVTVSVDDSDRVVVSSREPAMKVRNLRRRPQAWLCVFTDRFFGDWYQLEGEAEIVSLPDAMEGLVDYYRSVSGEHPDWDEYRRSMIDQERVLVRLAVHRVGPTRAG